MKARSNIRLLWVVTRHVSYLYRFFIRPVHGLDLLHLITVFIYNLHRSKTFYKRGKWVIQNSCNNRNFVKVSNLRLYSLAFPPISRREKNRSRPEPDREVMHWSHLVAVCRTTAPGNKERVMGALYPYGGKTEFCNSAIKIRTISKMVKPPV